MSHIFISYSKQDIAFARHLRKLLQDEGFAVWMDETRLVPSERWWPTIEQNILTCAAFIVIMSPQAQESQWVEREILVAEEKETRKPIFPVLFSGRPWRRLADIQYADMTAGLDAALPSELLEGLKDFVPRFTGAVVPPQLPGVTRSIDRSPNTHLIITALVTAVVILATLLIFAPRSLPGMRGNDSPSTPAPSQNAIIATEESRPTRTRSDEVPAPIMTDELFASDPFSEALERAQAGVSENSQWEVFVWTFGGVEMVLAPVGCFIMGSEDGDDDEKPAAQVCIDQPFWIDQYEVSNEQFERYSGQSAYESTWTDLNRPRESITWFEARDFCALRDSRLPIEKEWEYAARGPDNLIYPWGNIYSSVKVVSSEETTMDIGSKPEGVSWVGALDMVGNVWEWTGSLYMPYPYFDNETERDGDVDSNRGRAVRGGSFITDLAFHLRAAARIEGNPVRVNNDLGFRCARSA